MNEWDRNSIDKGKKIYLKKWTLKNYRIKWIE